jgi:polysaccharide export outer membrane protein
MTTRNLFLFLLLIGSFTAAGVAAEEPASAGGEAPATATSSPAATTRPVAYRLGPEDVLEVFVWKEPELSTTVTVRPDGRITLPLAGEVSASGKTPEELEREIRGTLAEYLEVPVVTVIVKEIRSPKVSVLGEVRHPGRHVISQKTSVLDAIALSGGLTEFANAGRVTVLRETEAGVQRIPVDLKAWLRGRASGKPFYLQPGDTVHVD